MRSYEAIRETNETFVRVNFSPDGSGNVNVKTGIPFFDHMLNAFGRHGDFDMTIEAKGDLQVDCHHTIEDVGIVLGQAIAGALGDKRGIERFSHMAVPMDEAIAYATLDLSGRPYLVMEGDL